MQSLIIKLSRSKKICGCIIIDDTLPEKEIFPSSVAIILPICLVSLVFSFDPKAIPWDITVYYLIGSGIGGILAGIAGKHIPTSWLHRGLGILVIWGGIRSLC